MSAPLQDKITLVLLPGMDGSGELFEAFATALDGEFDLSAVRYPLDGALGYAELESIAREAIPATGRYVILGESFSGPIGVSLAESAGSQCMGLVLCASFARNPLPYLAPLRAIIPVLPVSFAPSRLLRYLLLERDSAKALEVALGASLRRLSTGALRARLSAVLSIDMGAKLAHITQPIRYLRARKDRLVPASASRWVAAHAPHAVIVSVDAPHFLLQTQPREAARIVRDFVRKCEPVA